MGPALDIGVPGNPDATLTAACYKGNVPLVLDAKWLSAYAKFGTPDSIPSSFVNPAVQWQLSLDQAYTWQDIPGETNLHLSHVFNAPDTFYVRLRGSDGADIGNLNCNLVSNLIKVDVDSTPIGSVTSNSPVCEDSDVVFNLQGGATYLVTGPNGFSTDDPKAHVYHPSLADSGWYYTQIVSFGGCTSQDSVHVVIHGPKVTISGDESICYGQAVQLKAGGGGTYAWSPAAGLSNTSAAAPLASPVVTTKYQVKVTDQTGCGAFATVMVYLRDSLIQAAFSAPTVACPRDIVSFTDSSRGVLVGWAWDFGNGQSGMGKEAPSQVYPSDNQPVNYSVRLIVTDTAGCADTAVRIVTSANNCFIAVPNAFTPNGDGSNDYLYPLNAWKATDLVFRVYNRNGQLVYETRDWTKKWDGRINGTLAPGGVYVWTLDYVDADHKRQTQKGTTILIR
jgi:gliding motility-associated-like protein